MTRTLLIEGCAIATVDKAQNEYSSGYIVVTDGRISAIGEGKAPEGVASGAERIDGKGLLATPGLINTHHHLVQWATRGYAQDGTLFEWLTALYPVWVHLDEEITFGAAQAGLGALALTGCTLSMDHNYVFPRGGGDLLAAEIEAAQKIGVRFHPTRGSMDLGVSQGGLPPDEVVEDRDTILQACEEAVNKFHDPSPDSKLQIAIAPCSPFSVTGELMKEAAEFARSKGVRLHTHICETTDEEHYCLEHFGQRPIDYVADLGWVGEDVWFAHCIHLSDDEVAHFGKHKIGAAHCPSSNARLASGIARVKDLREAGAPVGLGVDGAASNEAGTMQLELREQLNLARLRVGDPKESTARIALQHGTIEGARCLGREQDLGSLEVGKLADIALWKLDDWGGAGISDPVAALVLGPPRSAWHVLVGGKQIVSEGRLLTVPEETLAVDLSAASTRIARKAGLLG